MTKVTVTVKNGIYTGFTAKGHSGYADEGSDIVCSAVSALTQTALIGLLEVVCADTDYYIRQDGEIFCNVLDKSAEKQKNASLIIQTMYAGLCNIAGNYDKFLSVTEREETTNV